MQMTLENNMNRGIGCNLRGGGGGSIPHHSSFHIRFLKSYSRVRRASGAVYTRSNLPCPARGFFYFSFFRNKVQSRPACMAPARSPATAHQETTREPTPCGLPQKRIHTYGTIVFSYPFRPILFLTQGGREMGRCRNPRNHCSRI